jgi:hypothetical protein
MAWAAGTVPNNLHAHAEVAFDRNFFADSFAPGYFSQQHEAIEAHQARFRSHGELLPWVHWNSALDREMKFCGQCPAEHRCPQFVSVTMGSGSRGQSALIPFPPPELFKSADLCGWRDDAHTGVIHKYVHALRVILERATASDWLQNFHAPENENRVWADRRWRGGVDGMGPVGAHEENPSGGSAGDGGEWPGDDGEFQAKL